MNNNIGKLKKKVDNKVFLKGRVLHQQDIMTGSIETTKAIRIDGGFHSLVKIVPL